MKCAALSLSVCLAIASSPEGFAQPPSAEQLVAQAAQNLARLPSLEAKLRQRVELFGKFLVGSGSYRQLTVGEARMSRLELKLQVADRLTSLLEVSDGTTLWIRRAIGDEPQLAYVNLRRVREALQGQGAAIGQTPAQQLAVGGLQQLLEGLNERFEFGPPRAAQMGDLPVWQLTGRWKADQLAALVGAQDADLAGNPVDLSQLPPHLPQAVALTLGRDDQIPLFPYRIQYLRLSEAPEQDAPPGGQRQPPRYTPVVTMELFEVRRYFEMDPRHFTFQPNDEQVEDQTDEYLSRLVK